MVSMFFNDFSFLLGIEFIGNMVLKGSEFVGFY